MFEFIYWLWMLYWPLSNPREIKEAKKNSAKYRAKKNIVRSLWIASGLMMLSFPLLPFMAALGLLTTFIAFTILDETA